MNDRELLELAAKAAGHGTYAWNPLESDQDALRLAVKLKMEVTIEGEEVWAGKSDNPWPDSFIVGADPYAATRRAIVRAAAEIDKAMD